MPPVVILPITGTVSFTSTGKETINDTRVHYSKIFNCESLQEKEIVVWGDITGAAGALQVWVEVSPVDYLLGDVDLNGVIEQADADLLSNYLAVNVSITDEEKVNADANGSGTLLAGDALLISQLVLGTIIRLPGQLFTQLATPSLLAIDGRLSLSWTTHSKFARVVCYAPTATAVAYWNVIVYVMGKE